MMARNDANQRKTNSSMWQSVCFRFRGAGGGHRKWCPKSSPRSNPVFVFVGQGCLNWRLSSALPVRDEANQQQRHNRCSSGWRLPISAISSATGSTLDLVACSARLHSVLDLHCLCARTGWSLTAPRCAAGEKHIASWRILILDSVAKMVPVAPRASGR